MIKGQIGKYCFTYWLEGDASHPALLFLHGFMGDRQEFNQQIRALSPYFYCIAIDLPAHGDSYLLSELLIESASLRGLQFNKESDFWWRSFAAPPEIGSLFYGEALSNDRGHGVSGQDSGQDSGTGANTFLLEPCYTMPAIANLLIKFLDSLGIKRCTPVGYSMGGRIALYLAVHFPKYCDRLILESTSAGLTTPSAKSDRLAQDLQIATKLATATPPQFDAFLDDWYRQPIFANLHAHPHFAELRDRRLAQHPLELAKCLYSLSVARQRSLWQDLPQIEMPILLITGALDSKFVQIHQQMARSLPSVQLEVIADCGHNVHFEQPQIFTALIQKFVL